MLANDGRDYVKNSTCGGYPTACHRVDRRDEDKMQMMLREKNIVSFMREDQLARKATGDLLVHGWFMVEDAPNKFRFIFDARGAYVEEEPWGWAKLPLGTQLCKRRLKRGECFRGSGSDIWGYFWTLKDHESGASRRAVGRRVSKKVSELYGLDPDIPHRQVLNTVGMGRQKSVCVAQATHE